MKIVLRSLQVWTAWVLARPRVVLGIALASALACLGLAAAKLDVQTNQLSLISPNFPLIKLMDRLDPFNFGGKATFTVVIEAPTPDQAVSYTKYLASRIEQDKQHFQALFYRVDPNLIKPWALYYVDKADLLDIHNSLQNYTRLIQGLSEHPDALTFLKLVNNEMASQMVGELFTGFLDNKDTKDANGHSKDKDPMDLSLLVKTLEGLQSYLNGSPDYKSPWSSFFKNASWDLDQEGYFWEGGKHYMLMFVVPNEKGDGFAGSQSDLDQLRKLITDAKTSFPGIRAGVTGQEALDNDQMETALSDMTRATWISLLGVLILLALFFLSLRRPLIEIIALAIGICWTFGWTTLVIGHLNILSVVFAPLLCGLGVDYSIHWFARFEEEERMPGSDRLSAIALVTERSGPAIILAALSTAFSFLPFLLTNFSGLAELGLITGAGILLIALADFTVLPALSAYMAGRPRKSSSSVEQESSRDLLRITRRQAWLILFAAGVLSCASLWIATKVHFDLNPLRLQDPTAQSVLWEKRLIDGSKRSLITAAALASSPEEVETKTKALEALPSVLDVESVFTLLPKDQKEKIPILRSMLQDFPQVQMAGIEDDPLDTDELVDILERIKFKMQADEASKSGADRSLIEQMGLVKNLSDQIAQEIRGDPAKYADPLNDYQQRFQEDLANTWDFFRNAASASPMTLQDLPSFLRDWFYHDGEYLLRIYPKESIWDEGTLSRFVDELQSVDPQVAGDPVALYVFASAFKKACVLASVYAIVVIFALLLATFRSLTLSLLALLPLAIGTIWVVGIMGIAHVNFNLANSIFMPLVVGAGVEYGVIILQRWREGRMIPGHLPFSTGKGVTLAALTTTVGFGTLMLSHHRGIFSLGFVAWAGSIFVLVAAIVLIPAMLAIIYPTTNVSKKEVNPNA